MAIRVMTDGALNDVSSEQAYGHCSRDLQIHVWATANATGTVQVLRRLSDADPWIVDQTVTNPTTAGQIVSVPPGRFSLKVATLSAGGPIQATMLGYVGTLEV